MCKNRKSNKQKKQNRFQIYIYKIIHRIYLLILVQLLIYLTDKVRNEIIKNINKCDKYVSIANKEIITLLVTH